jgi:hypothetical protein
MPLMTCSNVIQLLASNNYDPIWFCKNSKVSFGSICCRTCAGNVIDN